VGQVVHLEVADEVYRPDDGSLDLDKARPLMMTGSNQGMKFCTVTPIDQFEPFGTMFPDGKDPWRPSIPNKFLLLKSFVLFTLTLTLSPKGERG
jgi:hypothetical protein